MPISDTERCATPPVSVPQRGGLGLLRSGSDEVGAVGEIVGVYRQARTEGDPADGLATVCPVRVARRVPHW